MTSRARRSLSRRAGPTSACSTTSCTPPSSTGTTSRWNGRRTSPATSGLPGNYSFFKDKGNLSGFDVKQKAAVDLAISLGDAKTRIDLLQADLDYGRVKSLGDLTAVVKAPPAARFSDNPRERNTLYFFS